MTVSKRIAEILLRDVVTVGMLQQTMKEENVDIKVVVLRNNYLGLVREYQQREQDRLDYRLSLEASEKRGRRDEPWNRT